MTGELSKSMTSTATIEAAETSQIVAPGHSRSVSGLQAGEPRAEDRSSGRLISIDVLRGGAALAVVLLHIPHSVVGGWRSNPFLLPSLVIDYGYLGVSLFVVISGFCIHRRQAMRTAESQRQFRWRQFWKRRFWRLYPPYAVAAVVCVAAALWLHGDRKYLTDSMGWDVVSHAFLFHNLTSEFNLTLGNPVFWSLGMEEQLYLLYIPLFAVITRWGAGPAVRMAIATTVAWRLVTAFQVPPIDVGPFHFGSWSAWPFAYWMHWALGAYAAELYYQHRPFPQWTASWKIGLLLVAVGVLTNPNLFEALAGTSFGRSVPLMTAIATEGTTARALCRHTSDVVFCLWFFQIVCRGLQCEPLRTPGRLVRAFAAVGLMSYSLYLIHTPVILTMQKYLPQPLTPIGWLTRYAINVPLCVLAGMAFYFLVERHFLGAAPKRRPSAA